MSLKERSEILFIYHVKDANPNGDPLEANAPRTDPETGVATVTDVRIKRWIRDYWHDRLKKEIWVQEDHNEEGYVLQGYERYVKLMKEAEKLEKLENLNQAVDHAKETWVDIRTFGCIMPTSIKSISKNGIKLDSKGKGYTITLTGPVQFSGFNRSYHRIAPQMIQGTAAFASKPKQMQRSLREDFIVPYALIGAYGIVNEIAAKNTQMTEKDRVLVIEGLWNGCKDLISRSKFGHQPLLLLHIKYKDGYRIGDLASMIELKSDLPDEKIRGLKDFELDASVLHEKLFDNKDMISEIEIAKDSRLRIIKDDFSDKVHKQIKFTELKGLK
ncbi:MAG: type I-B CRISPR-associated protein Cas7/Csh2 [Candidatus Zixiibacteriota bacterium]